ncbi:MAG: FecR domain-containing protein [Bacteroidota bacterium]
MNAFEENIYPDLIIKFLHGEADSAETILVKEWLASSAENQAEFETMEKIWKASQIGFPEALAVDADKAWAKLSERISQSEAVQGIAPVRKFRSPYLTIGLKIAAVLLPLLVLTYVIISQYTKVKTKTFSTELAIANITLTDGTIVMMNQKSVLSYPETFSKKSREVSLNGEAFFTVTPNLTKPFIIHANNLDIRVVGTSFNVRALTNEDLIEVMVKTGRVRLYAINAAGEKKDSIMLEAGKTGIFNKKASLFMPVKEKVENTLFWINKTLQFNKTPLDSVFPQIVKYYGVKIKLKNNDIRKLRLTAKFEGLDADRILHIISESFGLNITKADSTFEIDVVQK